MATSGIVFLVVVGLIIVYVISIYNRLVSYQTRFKNAFAQIEVQLKRRFDLIPNLVEVAKKYMDHESGTLKEVVDARNSAQNGLAAAANAPGDPEAMKQLSAGANELSSALGRLNVVVEDYPELKANETMAQLSEELTTTENRVAFARQAFNDAVTLYNEFRQSFPAILFAGTFGHKKDAELLKFEDTVAIQAAPSVKF